MSNVVLIVMGLIVLVGLVVEMLTYNIGGEGAVARFYRNFKLTNFDLVVGFVVSTLMMWKGSTAVEIAGVAIYLVVAVKAIMRVDARIMEDLKQQERKDQ